MNDSLLGQVLRWLTDPANWAGGDGIAARTGEHLLVTVVSVGLATVVAMPVALWLGHLGRGGLLASAVANIGRAIPTLSLVVIFFLLSPSMPFQATVAALVIFAVPPILTNTYAGMREVDQDIVEAARGMGLTGTQVLTRIELPLAVPLVIAGLRIATTQVIATATIAAFVAGPGLGRFINAGLVRQDTAQFVGGAVLVALLAVAVEVAFMLLQRATDPRKDSRSDAVQDLQEEAAAAVPTGAPRSAALS